MSSSKPNSPDENFFNDLSKQTYTSRTSLKSRPAVERHHSSDGGGQDGDLVPKSKRIACVLCRKRKLKCDGTRPSCGTCSRLAHSCAYDDIRRKSGPKRGYVKALEERLARMENLLRTNGNTDSESSRAAVDTSHITSMDLDNTFQRFSSTPERQADATQTHNGATPIEAMRAQSSLSENYPENPFEMIGLGLEEPLPPQEAINELHDIYFVKIHPSFPMIHRRRYFAAMNLAPHVRPPVCLRYIMWTLAASISDKYELFAEHFYRRARKYAQADELRGHGEETITLAHCQTWALMSTYEFKLMYFPRAWLSTGRAVRLAQMMGLNRLDGKGLDVKQCIQPPKDWSEKEERRRTFWVVFCKDRYASIGTGWPMTIDERDITTNLPCSDQAFDRSQAVSTCSLEDSLNKATSLSSHSSFSGVVMLACLFGRNLTHLHRPSLHDNESDLNGNFWTRHRMIDNILLNTSLGLPDHLRLPAGMTDPNVVFLNMCLHSATICLHQAAIFKADKNNLGLNVTNESKVRCITAATEVASYMRMISHIDLSAMNPFMSFCLYVAARVFVQYLRSRPNEQQVRASLQFLLNAMQALRRKNPLTESFIAQLDVDIESSGVDELRVDPHSIKAAQFANSDATTCTPLFQNSNPSRSDTTNGTINSRSHSSNTPQSHSSATESPAISTSTAFTVPTVSDFKTGDTLDFVIPKPQGTVDLPSRQKSPVTRMDISPENLSDRPTPSTSTSHRGSSSHTSFTSPDDPYSTQHRKNNNNNNNNTNTNNNSPSLFGLNNTTSHASITTIHANANCVASETIVASPSQFFADTAAFDHLAADLYQSSMPEGVAASGITSAQDGLGMPANWDMSSSAAATTGMSLGPETGWQFDNLEWLAGAGV